MIAFYKYLHPIWLLSTNICILYGCFLQIFASYMVAFYKYLHPIWLLSTNICILYGCFLQIFASYMVAFKRVFLYSLGKPDGLGFEIKCQFINFQQKIFYTF